MKIVNESIFSSSIRAFFTAFFAVVGLFFALTLFSLAFYGIVKLSNEDSLSSDIKILPDALGRKKELSSSAPVILQINIKGEIGKEELTGEKVEKIFLKSQQGLLKNRIKAVLLHVDSPGGGVNAADQIYRLVKSYKNSYHVPIFAFVDGLCASGGYYISCAADKIYSTDVGVVGSVGVIISTPFFNVTKAIEKLGVDALTLSAGDGKSDLSPFKTWKPDESENYQQLINYFYAKFVEIVTVNRPLVAADKLIDVYGAGIFPAPKALELGYIDGIGYSRNKALEELALAAGISEDEKYQVVTIETKKWIDQLISEESFLKTGKVQHNFKLEEVQSPLRLSYLFSP